ncbi:transcription factor SOX-4 [Armigeres subalbatus]|uniref:transcription factor SOX-4-like n=1 Tax=Armigeres subalbatus TaxID=124917 RepID=UPI002ED458BD
MSYQCKNCEREKDQNNNYVNATYAANAHGTRGNRSGSTRSSRNAAGNGGGTNENANGSSHGSANGGTGSQVTGATQVTAKVMWGSVGAIKELREKEQAERNQVTRAGRRQ